VLPARKFTLGAGGNTFESVNGMSPSHIGGGSDTIID
jgi:hypothetical protein